LLSWGNTAEKHRMSLASVSFIKILPNSEVSRGRFQAFN
jgi:hypothetical protein